MCYADGLCDVCGQAAYAHTKRYFTAPFVDGKYYEYVCWVCANAPSDDMSGVLSIKEMEEDGFNKQEASVSINAIKKLISNKPVFVDIWKN